IFITLFAIGLNLLIRILAFVILLILAPVGFAFAFFPDTKGIANSWWSALLKYAFMGPIMVFFLYLAMSIFKWKGMPNNALNQIGEGAPSLEYFKFLIPIVFLWMGLIISQKFGGSGAGVAMNMAKKTGNKIKGYGQTLAWGGTKMIGRGVDMGSGYRISGGIGGLKSKWDSWGDNYKSKSERKKTKAADFLGVKGANEKLVQESRKKWKEAGGISDSEMARIDSKKGTKAEKMALALERSENKGFDKDPDKAFSQYQEGLKNLEGNKVYKDLFEKNVKKKNIDLLIRTKYEEEKTKLGRSLTSDETKNIAKTEFNKLSPLEWKDQNIERINFTNTKFGNLGVGIAAGEVISAYDNSARNKLMAEIGGEKYAQGKTGGLWP
ncbi:MAG: type IV secretion system protein, partial [Candidatus Moranbacteria bacterium]|nr:type IV secretion system protein [Candidatus Moranbacteria bacterium]